MLQKQTKKAVCALLLTVVLSMIFGIMTTYGEVNELSPETIHQNIMLNQVGYYLESTKVALFQPLKSGSEFVVKNAETGETVFTGVVAKKMEVACGDFSELRTPGTYYIMANGWRSATFRIADDVLDEAAKSAFSMFYYARCGCKLEDSEVGHEACHTAKAKLLNPNGQTSDVELDVSGGWHDAGDYGRYILPANVVVYDFLLAYQASPAFWGSDALNIPESGNGVPDLLDELRYELEWMLKMQDADSGGVYAQVSAKGMPGEEVMPDDSEAPRNDVLYVYPVTSAATASFAAAMAFASEVYLPLDAAFSTRMLEAAIRAYRYLEAHSSPVNDYIFRDGDGYNFSQYIVYEDTALRYAATLSLACVTEDEGFKAALQELIERDGIQHGLGFGSLADYANLQYLNLEESKADPALRERILNELKTSADAMAMVALQSPYFFSQTGYGWGSNTETQMNGALMASVGVAVKDDTLIVRAGQQLDFTLGCNAVSTCFMTGYGTFSPQHPHHRPSMATGNVKAGMIVNGPYQTPDGYQDHRDNYYCNEVSLYTNSSFLLNFTVCRENKTDVRVPTGAVPVTPSKPDTGTKEPVTTAPGTEETGDKTSGEGKDPQGGCRSAAPAGTAILAVGAAAPLICRKKRKQEKQ